MSEEETMQEETAPAEEDPRDVQIRELKRRLAELTLEKAPEAVSEAAPAAPGEAAAGYTVQEGDTLSGIAEKLGLGNWHSDLYQPNMNDIEEAARAAGHVGSNSGEMLIPGTVLHYR